VIAPTPTKADGLIVAAIGSTFYAPLSIIER
jgi:hypothetical protein